MGLIDRKPLRSQIRSHLVEQLLDGTLEPGRELNEIGLSEELGVSRTPLREALLQLQFEGLLQFSPGKGFSVAPLELEEMEELFELGIELESMALRLAGTPTSEKIGELRAINNEREQVLHEEGDRDVLVKIDDRWHQLLVADCSNNQLLELLRLVRNRLYRYIYAFEGETGEVEKAIREHEEIITALEEHDLDGAVQTLREHWRKSERTLRELMTEGLTEAARPSD